MWQNDRKISGSGSLQCPGTVTQPHYMFLWPSYQGRVPRALSLPPQGWQHESPLPAPAAPRGSRACKQSTALPFSWALQASKALQDDGRQHFKKKHSAPDTKELFCFIRNYSSAAQEFFYLLFSQEYPSVRPRWHLETCIGKKAKLEWKLIEKSLTHPLMISQKKRDGQQDWQILHIWV